MRPLTPPPNWRVAAGRLEREYDFPDFASALAFVNRVGALAEEANHHPDIGLSWGKVRLSLWTHDANALTEKDFSLADKIEALWHHASGPV